MKEEMKIRGYFQGKEEGYQKGINDVLDYLSKRGFRESNYEIIELTKWLRSKIKK